MNPTGSEDELFLNSSTRPVESPIVEPLRITKRDSPSPRMTSTQHSTATLPYPEDPPRSQQSHRSSSSSVNPSPNPGRLGSPGDTNIPSPSTGPGPLELSDYPPALRPRDGREPRPATLAERRGNRPKPLPDSPGPESPGKEALFPGRYMEIPAPPTSAIISQQSANTGANHHNQYKPAGQDMVGRDHSTFTTQNWPAPNSAINRISSTASVSTTRAQRGSPPPPETPVVGPEQQTGSDIEARYAAAGIAGTSTLSGLQAQSAAAQRRAEQYVGQQPRNQHPVPRPWTPTEQPGTQPHGPPTVYQGPGVAATESQVASGAVPSAAAPAQQAPRIPPHGLEQDFERMRVSSSPPPAYSSVSNPAISRPFSNEKQHPNGPTCHPATRNTANTSGDAGAQPAPAQDHPAFANDPRFQQVSSQSPQNINQNGQANFHQAQVSPSPAPSGLPPASPPPLPEGWIAHLDPNSGQYYYIHLPTQSTQWEFPKGPTPLNLNETPLSPVGSVYSSHPLSSPGLSAFGKPLASPGLPLTPGYESLQSPVTGFTGPPPSSGVDLYKISPTNGVYFGPYLRYTNMDLERGIWLGSILLVTDTIQPPTIHIHQSIDLSPNPRQLKPVNIAVHQRWKFYKYDIDLRMEESGPAKWTYAITSHLGCTRYEFLVAGRHETNWRFTATSGNDFSINVNANDRSRVGGVGFMWKDIIQKHNEIGGFHVQLCLGGQIYADRMWKEIPSLKQWLSTSGKEARKNTPWTAAHEEDVSHAYFHYYTSHFDQPFLREAFAQVPYICQIDDHDM